MISIVNKPQEVIDMISKIVLKILTVILCIILSISLFLSLLVLDINALVSKETIKEVLVSTIALPDPDSDEESPVVDAIFNVLAKESSFPSPGKAELTVFMRESTITDYMLDELATKLEDLIKGTDHAQVTTEEIKQLVNQNADLIEETFDLDLATSDRETFENILNDTVAPFVNANLDDIENLVIDGDDYTLGDLLGLIRPLLAESTLTWLLIINLVLVAAIFCTKRFHVAGTLFTTGRHLLGVTLTSSLFILIFQLFPDLLSGENLLIRILHAFIDVAGPIHYTLLALSVLLMAGAIVWKILFWRPKSRR